MVVTNERIFMGVYPCGIVYADRQREEHGDYKKLAFLSYSTLELDIQPDCPEELIEEIKADAKTIQDRKGEKFRTAQTGESAYVILGEDTRVKHW